MARLPTCLSLLLALTLLAPAGSARAQAYTYRDEHGRWHFTDNAAAVPEEYRDRVEERPMEVLAAGSRGEAEDASVVERILDQPLTGSEMTGADAIEGALGSLFAQVDRDRRARGLSPLSLQQKRALGEWARGSVLPWIAASVLSLLSTIALVIHGFSTGHPVWAVANLLVYVTQPVYVLLHLARDQALVRGAALLVVLAPWAISAYLMKGLFDVVRAMAA